MATRILLFLLVCLSSLAQITNVNIGSSANDGAGDTLRAAFSKVNTNTAWLASQVGITSNGLTSLSNLVGIVSQGTVNNFTVKTNLTSQFYNGVSSRNLITGELVNIQSGSTYWALGDSQTYGEYVATYNFTDASKRLYAVFRYPNIIASKYGFSLTNRAISGSRIAYTSVAPASTLAQANVIPASWSGLVTIMHGYNDGGGDNYGTSMRTTALFRSAGNAVIARLLAQDWINPDGTNSLGQAVGTYSTTGSVSDGGDPGYSPFPIGNPATDTRRILTLTGSQTVTFSATNPVVWVQTAPVGGTVQLWQGTNQIAGLDTDTADTSTYYLPQSMIGSGLSGTFTVTNVTGTNRILAVGAIRTPDVSTNRTVLVASPIRLNNGERFDIVIATIGNALRTAVQDWAGYQVGFADTASKMDLSTMLPAGDPNHPNPFGQKAMAIAFENAVRPDAVPSPGAPSPRSTDQGFQVKGAPSSLTQYEPGHGVIVSAQGNVGAVESLDTSTSTYKPLVLRGQRVEVQYSGFSVSGGFSTVADYFVGNQAALAMSSGQSYLDSFNYDGVSVSFLPLNLRAKRTQVSSGGFTISSGFGSSADFYVGNQMNLVHSASISYIDSINYNGTTATYLPLYFRGNRTQVATGGFCVSDGFVTPADYFVGNQATLHHSAGISYLTSVNSDGSSLSYIPLTIRAKRTQVESGGFTVSSAFSAIADFPVANQVSLTHNSGTSYLDSFNYNGSSVTYLPLIFRTSRAQFDNSGISVTGSIPAGSGQAVGNQVAAGISGGEGVINAVNWDGTNSTVIPLQLNGSIIKIPYGDLKIGSGGGSPGISMLTAQNQIGYIDLNTGITNRWRVAKNNTTEAGANAGSDFAIERYSDAGALLDTPLVIVRSTGRVGIGASGTPIRIRAGTAVLGAGGTVTVSDAFVTANSNIQLTGQADGGTPGWLRVTARTPGVSFTITSSSATDTSTVGWVMFEQ